MSINQIIYDYVISEETHSKGDVIIHEGSRNDTVYVILKGHVKIKKKTSRGQVTLATLKKGALLGESAFLTDGHKDRTASAVASSNSVRLGLLDKDRLRHEYESVSPRLKALIRSLTSRLRAANDKACDIVIQTQ